ncbi:MAG: 5'-methylthioadenosine/S-adenosylhomocysteine nucleosidase [Arcanobacterium sp.]|nr:5'-methylthioadenosine/S-adenosylhomocysteine nucleosidase [Arcanobacterium sp.]
MTHYSTIFVAAMADEMKELTTLLKSEEKIFSEESSDLPLKLLESAPILCITSGIGMVNAAATLASVLKEHSCERVICFGSAGGLSPDSRVQQVVVGTEYINSGADGTAFGYLRGQVPGEPPVFTADAELLKIAQSLQNTNLQDAKSFADENSSNPENTLRFAPMTSSDFFVTEKNVGDVRELFPEAVTADMETQAFAQVCNKAKIPFIAVRAISDLCGNPDDQSVSFHAELPIVASLAAKTALAIHNVATSEDLETNKL